MIKVPETKYPVLPAIVNRWSARSFSEKPITQESLNTILEAASWSFSAMNEQPWRYIVGFKGTETHDLLVKCLKHGNEPWAKKAAVLLVSLAKTTLSRDGSENHSAMHDVGAANMLLTLQATSMGIYTHLMGGYEVQSVIQDFKLSKEYQPVVVIALGYLDSPEKLEEPFHSREITPRVRKPIEEIIFNAD